MSYNARDKFNTGKKPPGFAGLDPSKMGLGMPDWLVPDSPPPAAPADASAAPVTEASSANSLPELPRETPAGAPGEPRTLLEGMKVVCICKGIKKRVFWKALDEGAQSKDEVNRLTGSGSGGCQGRRCGPRILEMLRDRLR